MSKHDTHARPIPDINRMPVHTVRENPLLYNDVVKPYGDRLDVRSEEIQRDALRRLRDLKTVTQGRRLFTHKVKIVVIQVILLALGSALIRLSFWLASVGMYTFLESNFGDTSAESSPLRFAAIAISVGVFCSGIACLCILADNLKRIARGNEVSNAFGTRGMNRLHAATTMIKKMIILSLYFAGLISVFIVLAFILKAVGS